MRKTSLLTIDEHAFASLQSIWPGTRLIENYFRPQAPEGYSLDKSKEEYDFLLYGALARRKGLHIVINALKLLHKTGFECKTLVRGAIVEENTLKKKEREDLHFLMSEGYIDFQEGWIDEQDVVDCILRSSTILLPYENFYAVSEVLNSGCDFKKKIIASDIGVVAETIKTHKVGKLFRRGDHQSLAEMMKESLKSQSPLPGLEKYRELLSHSTERCVKNIRLSVTEALRRRDDFKGGLRKSRGSF